MSFYGRQTFLKCTSCDERHRVKCLIKENIHPKEEIEFFEKAKAYKSQNCISRRAPANDSTPVGRVRLSLRPLVSPGVDRLDSAPSSSGPSVLLTSLAELLDLRLTSFADS